MAQFASTPSSIYPSLPNQQQQPKKIRQSLSAIVPGQDRDNTISFPPSYVSSSLGDASRKKRSMSVGGGGRGENAAPADPTLLMVGKHGEELSPRRLSRRMAKPRKSILKMVTIPSLSGSTMPDSATSSPRSPRATNKSSPRSSSRSPAQHSSRGLSSQSNNNNVNNSPLRTVDYAHTTDFRHMIRDNSGANGEDDEDGFEDEIEDPTVDPLGLGRNATNGVARPKFTPAVNRPHVRQSIGPMTTTSTYLNSNQTMSPRSLQSEAARKQARREFLARRKSVTFAAHAHVRMFEKEKEDANLSVIEGGGTPSPAQPNKVMAMSDKARENATTVTDHNATSESGLEAGQASQRKSNVFAFTTVPPPTLAERETVGDAPPSRRNSNANASVSARRSGHGRQSSITGLPIDFVLGSGSTTTASAPNPTLPISSRSVFATQDGGNVTLDEESAMDIETESEGDEEDAEGEIDLGDVDEYDGQSQNDNLHGSVSGLFAPSVATPILNNQQTPPRVMRGRLSLGTDENGEDITVDMDITQIISAGIRNPATGSPASTVDGRDDDDDDDDEDEEEGDANDDSIAQEERTMDFTVALGGFVPAVPPANAWHDRRSIGYSVAGAITAEEELSFGSPVDNRVNSFTSGASMGQVFTLPAAAVQPYNHISYEDDEDDESDDDEGAMEETNVFGGIIGGGNDRRASNARLSLAQSEVSMDIESPNKSHMSGYSDAEGMDFTIARGGIFSAPNGGEPIRFNVTSPTDASVSHSGNGSSNMSRYQQQDDDIEYEPEEPSFARPTVASQAKHVFSPQKNSGTESASSTPQAPSPTKRAMNRAIFGSPSKKGLYEAQDANVLEQRPVSPSKNSARYATTSRSPFRPARSFGTPERQRTLNATSSTPSTKLGASPGRSLFASRSSIGPFPSQASVEQPEWAQQEYSTITLSTFLDMTGVHFMENMTTGGRRKSTIGGGLGPEVVARMMEMDAKGERDFALHDYARAVISTAQYNMYNWGCNQMRKDIETGQKELEQYDIDISEDNPPVVREYLAASDEDKGFFELTIKNLKTNAHLVAREKWYDWRQSIVNQLKPAVNQYLENLKEDHFRIQALRTKTAEVLPKLREQYERLQEELANERIEVAKVEECDAEELKELKAGIAEQSLIINGSLSEKTEQEQKLSSLELKHAELKAQRKTILAAIKIAKREIDQQKGFTKGDLLTLQEQLRSLEHLHLWRIKTLQHDELVFTYDNEVSFSVVCHNYKPDVKTAEVTYIKDLERSNLAKATEDLFGVFECIVRKEAQRQDKLVPVSVV